MRTAIACLLTAPLLFAALPALGIGAYSHIHISQVAADRLPEGPLRELLLDPGGVAAFEAGSMFPDSGYVFGDPYGELAHWPEFQDAYLAWLRDAYGGDYTSLAARQHVAFLLGDLSHGLADQVYDYALLARSEEVDPGGEYSADELADYFLVVDHGVLIDTVAWGPYDDLAAVFGDRAGLDVAPDTLSRGMSGMASVIFVQRTVARGRYLAAWNAYPFLGTHIYNPDAFGSIPHLGDVVAAHWLVAWDRLRGEATPDTHLVSATVPPDGAVNVPVSAADAGEAYFRFGIAFSEGVRRAQVAEHVALRDPAGEPVPVRVRSPYGRAVSNYVFLDPREALAYDTDYTLHVAAGVETLAGTMNTAPYAFTFRTRCAPDRLDDCPPLAPPLETGPIPTEVPPEPGPDVVEPSPDVVEPTPDVVEPTPDVVAPPPDDDAAAGEPDGGGSFPDAADDDAAEDASAPPDGGGADAAADAALIDVAGDDGGGGGNGGGCAAGGRAPAAPLALLLLGIAVAVTRGRRYQRGRTSRRSPPEKSEQAPA